MDNQTGPRGGCWFPLGLIFLLLGLIAGLIALS